MLVKHALEVKDEQAAQKPGNYDSLHSAVGGVKFPPLPQSIKQAIPRGIVVFFEGNRTSLCLPEHQKVNSWVIETVWILPFRKTLHSRRGGHGKWWRNTILTGFGNLCEIK